MMENKNKIKPIVEEIASDYLDGDALYNVLDFTAWLRANKMTPTFGNKSKEGVRYTTRVLFLKLFQGYWEIWISGKAKNGKYIDDFLTCEELKEIVSEGLARCSDECGHKCNNGQGYIVAVCGTEFEKICGCCTVRFLNPNAETISIIKKVIEKRNSIKE